MWLAFGLVWLACGLVWLACGLVWLARGDGLVWLCGCFGFLSWLSVVQYDFFLCGCIFSMEGLLFVS